MGHVLRLGAFRAKSGARPGPEILEVMLDQAQSRPHAKEVANDFQSSCYQETERQERRGHVQARADPAGALGGKLRTHLQVPGAPGSPTSRQGSRSWCLGPSPGPLPGGRRSCRRRGRGGQGRAWERGALVGPGGPVPEPPCRICPSCEHSRVVLFCSTATGPVAVPALTIAPGPLLTVSPPG